MCATTIAGVVRTGDRRVRQLAPRQHPRRIHRPASSNPAALAASQCMRAHGVTNFPDPTFPAGGGIERPEVPGLNLSAPAVQPVEVTCNR